MPVHPSVAAALLAYAASTDNRTVTEEAARGWADALDAKVNLADGKAAIAAHRTRSADWLMPAHVNAGVLAIRRARLDAMQTPQPPSSLDGHPAREIAWQRAYRDAIGSGAAADEAMAVACESVGTAAPSPVGSAGRPLELAHVHVGGCEHGCLTKPVRASEGAER